MEINLSDISRMSSARFTLENSGYRANEVPPWFIDEKTLCTYAAWCRPIGYTMNPPFKARWESDVSRAVAIMYETPEGGLMWWHHMLPEGYNMQEGENECGNECGKEYKPEELKRVRDEMDRLGTALGTSARKADEEIRRLMDEALAGAES